MSFVNRIANRVGDIADIRKDVEEAKRLGKIRKYRSAIKIVNDLIEKNSHSKWSLLHSVQKLFVNDSLDEIYILSKNWRSIVERVDTLIRIAREQMYVCSLDPLQVEPVEKALSLYANANKILDDLDLTLELQKCKLELQTRIKFKFLLEEANKHSEQKLFQNALHSLEEAQKLYNTNLIAQEIRTYNTKIKLEIQYETQLHKVEKIAKEGNFSEALSLLELTLTNFSRADGLTLQKKLNRIIKGKTYFHEGLKAENSKSYLSAKSLYKKSLEELPEIVGIRVRLAVVLIKILDYSKAILELQNLQGEKADYLRGFIYAKQGKFQEANKLWKTSDKFEIQRQRFLLKTHIQHKQAQAIFKIENYINQEKLEEAELESIDFLNKYGAHEIVQRNLEKYIQPCLAKKRWETHDWKNIYSISEREWRNFLNIKSLHNLAVSAYYHALENPKMLPELIMIWSTAIANFEINPAIKNLPWTASLSISFEELKITIVQLIEDLLDLVKDKSLDQYLSLRDAYRREVVFLKLISDSPSAGFKAKQLTISPSCYKRYEQIFPQYSFPQNDWATLYTIWGEAVAACLDGDVVRAIQIKPSRAAILELEKLAQNIVYYHEGCYHLKNLDWKRSLDLFQEIKLELKKRKNWQEEINKLCIEQRQNIEKQEDHLRFAQFWNELLNSQASKSYLTEYKVEEIREQISADKISFKKALEELEKLKNIDLKNPILIDLIDRVEMGIESQEIEQLFKQNRVEDVVIKARHSRHQSVREFVLSIICEALMSGIESNSLSQQEIHKLGRWAYEISPNDPVLQTFYMNFGFI